METLLAARLVFFWGGKTEIVSRGIAQISVVQMRLERYYLVGNQTPWTDPLHLGSVRWLVAGLGKRREEATSKVGCVSECVGRVVAQWLCTVPAVG